MRNDIEAAIGSDEGIFAAIDALGKRALRVREERDIAVRALDTLIVNMTTYLRNAHVPSDNEPASKMEEMIHLWLEYASEQRTRVE